MIMPVSWVFEGDDDRNELEKDRERINEHKKGKKYMDEIILDDNKRLDELFLELLQREDNVDVKKWETIKLVFDFLKSKNK
jgi:hypothetical protein